MESNREIIFYKDYFEQFFNQLDEKTKEKIDEVLFMITFLDKIPRNFFKSIEGIKGLYEIRIEYKSNIYRIFCCFDKGNLVVYLMDFKRKLKKHHQTN